VCVVKMTKNRVKKNNARNLIRQDHPKKVKWQVVIPTWGIGHGMGHKDLSFLKARNPQAVRLKKSLEERSFGMEQGREVWLPPFRRR